MQRHDRKLALRFLFRFALVFVILLLPLPWLADAYTTAFDITANQVLCPIFNDLSDELMHFEPPANIARRGSWNATLRLEDSRTGHFTRVQVNARTFSYRPLATFLALALAAPLTGRRLKLKVIGGGAILMYALGLLFSGLLMLALLSAGGSLGVRLSLTVRTTYEAIATPVMVYAMPLIVFWSLVLVRRS